MNHQNQEIFNSSPVQLERYRPTMDAEVLHSWAKDAQETIDRLMSEQKAPYALFDGSTYYPAPGWMGHRGQYGTIEDAAVDGRKYADDQYGWWQVVDLRTLKIVAGEGSGHTGLFGKCAANPHSDENP